MLIAAANSSFALMLGAAAVFVWPLIGNALLNFRQRTIVLCYCDEAISQFGIRCRAR
jgi:hypothetical protein